MKKIALLFSSLIVANISTGALISEFNFNTDGDTEGWLTPPSLNITGLTTSGGLLTGVAAGNDPQLKFNTLNITTTESWDTLVFRVRETENEGGVVAAFDAVGLNLVTNAVGAPATQTLNSASGVFSSVDSGDGFFTVTVDISTISSTIVDVRLDPIGGASSNSNSQTDLNTFEVDFIQIFDTSAVPEPSTYALFGGLLALTFVALKRRKRIS